MLWNFFLRLWIESYIDMSISNMLRVIQYSIFDNWYESMSSVIAILVATVGIIGFPIAVVAFLYKYRFDINKPEF